MSGIAPLLLNSITIGELHLKCIPLVIALEMREFYKFMRIHSKNVSGSLNCKSPFLKVELFHSKFPVSRLKVTQFQEIGTFLQL